MINMEGQTRSSLASALRITKSSLSLALVFDNSEEGMRIAGFMDYLIAASASQGRGFKLMWGQPVFPQMRVERTDE